MKNFLKVLIITCSISSLQFINAISEIIIDDKKFEEYISEEQLQSRIKELAMKIDIAYQGKTPVVIGVLNGAFIFLADLVRELKINCVIDFIKIASYGDSHTSSGVIKLLTTPTTDLEGKDVIIVEDIIDTGLSMKFLINFLQERNVNSISIASLLVKTECIEYPVEINYVGFEIAPEFVIGYGLDEKEKYRNLKSIYHLVK